MEPHPYGWLSLSPPLVAIVLAIATRRVVPSLVVGILAGSLLMSGGNPIEAAFDTWETHLWQTLIDPGKLRIFSFTLLMGALVGVISRSGGMRGLIRLVTPWASTRRRGQLATWILGLVIFFDDYANTILLGNTLRPICDRLKISREKLAYLVDSTAAPIAGLAIVSTWIAIELDFIASGLAAVPGLDDVSPFEIFLDTIPYRFYVWGALLFVPLTAILARDFGPMRTAELRRVHAAAGAAPESLAEESLADADDAPVAAWYHAAVPLAVTLVLVGTFIYTTGASAKARDVAAAAIAAVGQSGEPDRQAIRETVFEVKRAAADGDLSATLTRVEELGRAVDPVRGGGGDVSVFERTVSLREIVGAGDSTLALQYGSLVGLIVAGIMALAARLLTWDQWMSAAYGGARVVLPALAILWTASALSRMTTGTSVRGETPSEPYEFRDHRLYTGDFLAELLAGRSNAPGFGDTSGRVPAPGGLSPNSAAPGYSASWLPTIVFVVSAVVAFCTGTSWGTMGLLIPMAFPLTRALLLRDGVEMTAGQPILLAAVGGVLAGAIFGDHCSPISDTTVLSSQASGCDHLAHVWTQLPYASVVAIASVVLGTIPVGLGFSVWVLLPLQAIALVGAVWWFGKPMPK
jgi:Na+/H+ antiporter NhaC